METQREIVKRFPAAEKIVDHRLEMEPTALVERKIYGAHPTCAPGFTSADGEITVRVPSGLDLALSHDHALAFDTHHFPGSENWPRSIPPLPAQAPRDPLS